MSSRGGYTAAPPRQRVERCCNSPPVRRNQQVCSQQQQVMQRELPQRRQQQQRLVQRTAVPESSTEVVAEQRIDAGDSAVGAAFSVPRSDSPAGTSKLTNLDRLMESVTPFIQVHERQNQDSDSQPYFNLEDLWESFNEWSAYGAEVPLRLNGTDTVNQYYVPFLSGIQLYADPSKPSSYIRGSDEVSGSESYRLQNTAGNSVYEGDRRLASSVQRMSRSPVGDATIVTPLSSEAAMPGSCVFQYLEHEQPYNRRPLTDKVSLLTSQFPDLSKYRSCDLLPSSWMCVAWYPIYRIPVGPTLQDLDASFLTFHSLSTQPRSQWPHQFHAANTRKAAWGVLDPTAQISLPVFALASYKLKGSIISPCGPHECGQEYVLLQAADAWLRHLQVHLPDYQFFSTHYSHRR